MNKKLLKDLCLARNIKNKIYRFAKKYISRTYLVEGVMKNTRQQFRCFIVENSDLFEYISPQLYEFPPVILRKGVLWIPMLKKKIQRNTYGVDMCIAIIPKRYLPKFRDIYCYRTQEYVHQQLDITGSWEQIKRNFHKNPKETQRKIRKYGFTYRISKNITDFDNFYYKMFLPLMRTQYANRVFIDSYDELKDYFIKGFLLMLMDREQPISAGLCSQKKNDLIFYRVGVNCEDGNYRKKGAQSAVYYFIIEYAKDQKFNKVDFMLSRFILNDGVYKTKREWGATTCLDDALKSWVYFFIPKHTDKIINVFINTPIIVHTDNGLEGIIGWKDDLPITPERKMHLLKKFYDPGLSGLQLLTHDPEGKVRISFARYIHPKEVRGQQGIQG